MMHIKSLSILLLVTLISVGFANDLGEVQIGNGKYEVTDQTISVDSIQLNNTNAEALSQHFLQSGGSVQTNQLLVDNGIVQINGGEFNANRIAMGDPTTQRVRLENFGTVMLQTDEPVSIQRLDLQSRNGLLRSIPLDEFHHDGDFPFQTTVDTPERVTFESDQPISADGFFEFPVFYDGFDPTDLVATLGDANDRTLKSEFEQRGGLVNVSNNLELCVPAGVGLTVVDTSVGSYERMSYSLFDGELNVGGDFVVGSIGVAPTIFEQTGGSSLVEGTLRVDGDNSRAKISRGSASIGRLDVGPGELELGSEASIYITDAMRIGATGMFSTTGDDVGIEFAAGADFSVEFWEEPFTVPGLTSLDLSFEGSEADTDSVSQLEVFHWDAGPDSVSGANFSLGDLHIGSNGEPAQVQLVDDFSNNWADFNSIYVETLTLSAGSTLDLNRLNLYYDELILGDGAEIINQGPNCANFDMYEPSDLQCADSGNIEYLLEKMFTPVGDLNLDGVVNFPDFLILSDNFGEEGVGYQGGDTNLDGIVGFPDFLQLSTHWGETGNTWIVDEATSVPEPAGGRLLLVGIVGCLGFTRRVKRVC